MYHVELRTRISISARTTSSTIIYHIYPSRVLDIIGIPSTALSKHSRASSTLHRIGRIHERVKEITRTSESALVHRGNTMDAHTSTFFYINAPPSHGSVRDAAPCNPPRTAQSNTSAQVIHFRLFLCTRNAHYGRAYTVSPKSAHTAT